MIGAFEAQFVVALLVLADCRWLVLEAGIGGRYDPVRPRAVPVSALVSLDLEHTELLGKTLPEIAFDKLDATAQGGLAEYSANPVSRSRSSCATTPGSPASQSNSSGLCLAQWRRGRWLADFRSGRVSGFALAAGRPASDQQPRCRRSTRSRTPETIRLLWPIANIETRWREAIAAVQWPGRLETLSQDPLVIIDVGHTPEGIKAALEGFRALAGGRQAILVTGDRRTSTCAKCSRSLRQPSIPSSAPRPLTTDLRRQKSRRSSRHPAASPHAVCPTIEDAVVNARNEAARTGAAIYVAGGLFLARICRSLAWRGSVEIAVFLKMRTGGPRSQ